MAFSEVRSGTHQNGKPRTKQAPFQGIDPHVSRKLRRARTRLADRIASAPNGPGFTKPGSMKMR